MSTVIFFPLQKLLIKAWWPLYIQYDKRPHIIYSYGIIHFEICFTLSAFARCVNLVLIFQVTITAVKFTPRYTLIPLGHLLRHFLTRENHREEYLLFNTYYSFYSVFSQPVIYIFFPYSKCVLITYYIYKKMTN